MSGVVYSYNNRESDSEFTERGNKSESSTRNSAAETKHRTPVPSPRKPPRPASMAGAVPRRANGQNSNGDTSLEIEDIDLTDARPSRHPKTSSPKTQPTVQTVSGRTQPDNKAPSQRSEPLSEEERKKKILKNRAKAAEEPEADDDVDFYSFIQRHKKPLMVVVLVLLLALCIAIGIGARSASMVSIDGAFARTMGESCDQVCLNDYPTTPLVVIALNGFQKDFFRHKLLVKNIARLAECGVRGDTIPSYPSTAIPNLYSIVTGIHPSYQGKAGDWVRNMNSTEYGPEDYPNSYSRRDPRWFQTNGLWGVAADSGMLTASHSWIGREGDIDEDRTPSPSYFQTFIRGVDYSSRIQAVLNWLHLEPSERPGFITVYFEDPGETAMKYGLDTQQTMDSLAKVDNAIGKLMDHLMEAGDLGCVNVMVVSTGGVADRNCDRVNYLVDDLRDVDKYTLLPDWITSVGRVTATDESPRDMDTAEELLDHLQCRIDNGQVYTKRLLPVQLRSSYGLQLEDTIVLMDEGWTFAKKQEDYNRSMCRGASDSFNPFGQNMQGMFVGYGKSFKVNTIVPSAMNVDLYELMAELTNVMPRDNNGTAGLLKSALKLPKTLDSNPVEFSSANNNECSYPVEDTEYNRRQSDSETACQCTQATLNSYSETRDITLKDMDNILRFTNFGSSTAKNAPFGLPKILRYFGSPGRQSHENLNYCMLLQNNFLSAYDNLLKIPFYALFEVQQNSQSVTQIANCVRYDVRLKPENTPKCSSYQALVNPQLPNGMKYGFMYDPSFADSIENEFNALTSSNIVPQYSEFKNNVWQPLARKIKQMANQGNRSSTMNVVIGPVYDWDSDMWRDTYFDVASSDAWVEETPVPTHYFVVVSRCLQDVSLSNCELSSLEVISFVLPHSNSARICKTMDDYLSIHRASLNDVELITGLQLFPDLRDDSNEGIEMFKFKSRLPDMSPWLL